MQYRLPRQSGFFLNNVGGQRAIFLGLLRVGFGNTKVSFRNGRRHFESCPCFLTALLNSIRTSVNEAAKASGEWLFF